MWYVYILKCSDNTLYTGATNDVDRRVKDHNRKKGGSYTRARLPVTLIYKETLPDKSAALKREARIKSFSRVKKLELVAMRSQIPSNS
ncbi:MAG: GIY-YIG nuclease family protein [Candidatus Omnitrophica bacterium]|jgi:putative endonuclease|nr:GIY-YIG nuclease family protein [Candidatus Omnitrophota bacterium]